MYLEKLPESLKTTTPVMIRYDCDGGFERCGKEWNLLWKDANKNFLANNGKHVCRSCTMRNKNPMSRKETIAKVKKTTVERYGVTCVMNTAENTKARVEKMFGTQEAIDSRTEKTKTTNLERYGVEHAAHSEFFAKKAKETSQERYGHDYPQQSEEVRSKTAETVKERYGVGNVAQVEEFKEKQRATMMERYGVEYYNQLPEMKDYLREHCTEWLLESYLNPWAKGIKRPEEWNQKQRETVSKKILEGDWSGGFTSNCKGRFPAWKCKKEKPRFLSSLELIFHFYLNTNNNVEYYDYECLKIPYKKQDGSCHLYFPDFLVKYYNDSSSHIYETKTYKNKDKIDVKLKYDAALDFAENNNMTYTLLFDEDIEELGFDLDSVKKFPGISFL